jgi:peptide deformylase
MAVLPVLAYPHPFLKEKTPEMASFDGGTGALLADLWDTMVHHPGCVGLAAPQIGRLARCIVVDVSRASRPVENNGPLQLVNPRILEASQWKTGREGCSSFPDLLANVKRAQKIRVASWDPNGRDWDFTSFGFEAVVLQHEIDHLDGLLFLDRIRSSKDLFERRKIQHQPL